MHFNIQSLAILAFGALLAGCSSSTEKTQTEAVHNVFLTQPVAVGGDGVVALPASVEEARSISVGFKTAGQIARVMAKEGDRVAKGQVLAVLDTVDYALGVNQLRVQYEQQLKEYERQKQLHAARNMTDNDFDKATAGLQQMALNVKLNENKLDYCVLRSPASGVITKRNFENSEMVDAGTPVFELMDNSHLEVVVDLPVNLYLQRGAFKSFTGRATHEQGVAIPLSLLSLTPRADKSQLYRLKLGLNGESSAKLTPGMDMTVEIQLEGATGGAEEIAVPASAVFQADGQAKVWLFNAADSTIKAVPVAVLSNGEDGVLQVSGELGAMPQIVRAGVHHLVEGEKVNVLAESSATNPGNAL